MSTFDQVIGLCLLLLLLVGGVGRALLGPTTFDRMVALQFVATSGVAILLLLAFGLGAAALMDVALVVALFAAVAGIALVRRPPSPPDGPP
jgi:multicomponent Na+:H+ antiporter subunit F